MARRGKNAFSPANPDRGQGSTFEPGRVFGSIVVVFDGSPLTWTIQPAGGPEKSVTAKFGVSPVCPKLKPITECIMALPAGGFQATFGYKNDFTFQVKIPVGPYNKFSPAPEDRAQPTNFFTGRVNNYFTTSSSNGAALTWKVGKEEALATASSTPCMPGVQPDPSTPPGSACTATDALDTKADLARGLRKQSELVNEAVARLQAVSSNAESTALIAGIRTDLARLNARNTEILGTIPADIKSCIGASCQLVDLQPLLDEYRANTEALRTLAKKALRKVEQSVGSISHADRKLAKQADKAVAKILELAAVLPRFHSQC